MILALGVQFTFDDSTFYMFPSVEQVRAAKDDLLLAAIRVFAQESDGELRDLMILPQIPYLKPQKSSVRSA